MAGGGGESVTDVLRKLTNLLEIGEKLSASDSQTYLPHIQNLVSQVTTATQNPSDAALMAELSKTLDESISRLQSGGGAHPRLPRISTESAPASRGVRFSEAADDVKVMTPTKTLNHAASVPNLGGHPDPVHLSSPSHQRTRPRTLMEAKQVIRSPSLKKILKTPVMLIVRKDEDGEEENIRRRRISGRDRFFGLPELFTVNSFLGHQKGSMEVAANHVEAANAAEADARRVMASADSGTPPSSPPLPAQPVNPFAVAQAFAPAPALPPTPPAPLPVPAAAPAPQQQEPPPPPPEPAAPASPPPPANGSSPAPAAPATPPSATTPAEDWELAEIRRKEGQISKLRTSSKRGTLVEPKATEKAKGPERVSVKLLGQPIVGQSLVVITELAMGATQKVMFNWERVKYANGQPTTEHVVGGPPDYQVTEADLGSKLRVVVLTVMQDGTEFAAGIAETEEIRAKGAQLESSKSFNERAKGGGAGGGGNEAHRDGTRRHGLTTELNDRVYNKVVVPKNRATRDRLRRALSGCMVFQGMDEKSLNEVIDTMFPIRVESGESVVRQGDQGDQFFVVDAGKLEITSIDEDGRQAEMQTMGPDEHFGELCLLENSVRDATVRALTMATLWACTRATFNHVVIETSRKDPGVHEFLLGVKLFEGLKHGHLRRAAHLLRPQVYKKGDVIVREGEESTDIYVVRRGVVSVIFEEKEVREITTSHTFGESAALSGDNVRTATVVAKSDEVELLQMDGKNFEVLLQYGMLEMFEYTLTVECLQSLPDFHVLSEALLVKHVVHKIQREKFTKGQVLVREGDAGDKFLIVRKGKVAVVKLDPAEGKHRLLTIMGMRSTVGARALLSDQPHAATVVADTDEVECLSLDGESFRLLVQLREVEGRLNLLRNVELLKGLTPSQLERLARLLKLEKFPPLHQILRRGSPNSKLYIIREGSVCAYHPGTNGHMETRVFEAGTSFGERVLLKSELAAMDVVTQGPVECYTMDKITFSSQLMDLEEVLMSYAEIRELRRWAGGASLKDFQRIATLGVGQFGRVFLVKYLVTGQTFALKELSKMSIIKSGQAEHIRSEKLVLDEIDHPFCTRLIRTFNDRDFVYMMTEVAMGGEVFTHLRQSPTKRFDERTAKFIAACVVCAIEHLHLRGIMYRDLKPENLLLDKRGYVKLADYGFAKKVGPTLRSFTLCGTPDYMAPEIITYRGHGKEADHWSLGVLVYELLTGTAPFSVATGAPDDTLKTYKRILKGEYAMPSHISPEAKDFIRRLIAMNPRSRLGCGAGRWTEVKTHPWMQEIDYKDLLRRRIPPPLIPKVESAMDTSNFVNYEDEEGAGGQAVTKSTYALHIPELEGIF